jgi:hypothetical protein
MLPRVFIALLAASLVLLAACDRGGGGVTYATDWGDDEYDLEAMSLREADLPEGYMEQDRAAFGNDEWAEILDDTDPEGKRRQLEAMGRIRNAITIFSRERPLEHLGRPYQFSSHSTLFESAELAARSLETFCDLPIDDTNPIEDFDVPRIGDQSTGFSVSEQLQNFGESIDTIVCFRTGRVVHAVVQSGLEGTERRELSIELAQKMENNIRGFFKGEPVPADDAG